MSKVPETLMALLLPHWPHVPRETIREIIERVALSATFNEHLFLSNDLIAGCRSPIEVAFAQSFIRHCQPLGMRDGALHGLRYCFANDECFGQVYSLRPQPKLEAVDGVLTPDFELTLVSGDRAESPGTVFIECDGHDFHERTKEQVARDRRRERRVIAAGYRMLRFTGSELWRDADECMCEALVLLGGADGA